MRELKERQESTLLVDRMNFYLHNARGMALIIEDCPRCGAASITFDIRGQVYLRQEFDWVDYYEVFCRCRNCKKSTTFVISLSNHAAQSIFSDGERLLKYESTLNSYFSIHGYISLKDVRTIDSPEHVPTDINDAFKEAVTCLKVECNNAAGAMFRLCIDLATKPLLPDPTDATKPQPNQKQRRELGLRISWLLDNNFLPEMLRDLASSIREDGNDGAHAGSLTKEDAEDLLDFTTSLLERLYTEPERLKLAEKRRTERRKKKVLVTQK